MANICIIGEKELITGFKLVGVNDTFIADSVNGIKFLRELYKSRKYNVILASQSLQKNLKIDEINEYAGSMDPLVIFIPIPGIKEEESVYDLAKKILGIDIGD
jgi:V/A-type H+-transporting ATPase subunit F